MRTNMTLKLCPILALLISAVSCGKKTTDTNDVTSSTNVQNQVPSSNVVVELNTHASLSTTYQVRTPGVFTIPDRLKIKTGNLAGRKVSLTFVTSDRDSDFMKCTYASSAAQPLEMDVETCYDAETNDLGNATTEPLPMQAGNKIVMKLEGSNSAVDVFAYFSVDWK